MADFLGTLAARSLGQLPSVMPRRASRFEDDTLPATIDALDALDGGQPSYRALRFEGDATRAIIDDGIDPAESPHRSPDAGASRATARQPPARASVEPPEPGSMLGVAAPAHGDNHGDPSPADEFVEWQVIEPERGEPSTEQRANGSPSAPGTPVPRPDATSDGAHVPFIPEAIVAAPPELDGSRDTGSPSPQHHRPVSAEPLSFQIERGEPENHALGEPAREAASERGDALRVPTMVATPDRGDEPSYLVDREPGPRVTVTIGRIEVKAAPAPQPSPPKPRSQPPRLSLDDYLRRERGR